MMTLNWAMQVCKEPKLVAVSVESDAFTCELVQQAGAFAVSILERSQSPVVRKFVKPAEYADGKLNGFAIFEAQSGCPVLESAVAYLDCHVRHSLVLGSHTLFVGEIVNAGELSSPDSPVLRMEDTKMSYGG